LACGVVSSCQIADHLGRATTPTCTGRQRPSSGVSRVQPNTSEPVRQVGPGVMHDQVAPLAAHRRVGQLPQRAPELGVLVQGVDAGGE